MGCSKPSLPARLAGPVSGYMATAHGTLSDAVTETAATPGLTSAQHDRLSALAAFWRELAAAGPDRPVARSIEQIVQFLPIWQGEPWSEVDAGHLQQLARRAVAYVGHLTDFLEATALQSETDAYDPRADRVALLTLHAAKGLEFPVVFIAGCEEGLLPYIRAGIDPDIEEERRLFYVGLTRARHKLVLTNARTRFLFGQRLEHRPSRYLEDIESALKEVQEQQRRGPQRPDGKQLSLF